MTASLRSAAGLEGVVDLHTLHNHAAGFGSAICRGKQVACAGRDVGIYVDDLQRCCVAQVSSIEARCNAEIQQARAVRVRVYDAAHVGEVTASPLFRGRLPPASKVQVHANAVIALRIQMT